MELSKDQEIHRLEQRVRDLESMLLRSAEVIAAQTFDVKALGKGRRYHVVGIVSQMLSAVEGDMHPLRRACPDEWINPAYRIRERFAEDLTNP